MDSGGFWGAPEGHWKALESLGDFGVYWGLWKVRGGTAGRELTLMPPQITVHKGDACTLLSQAQGHRWRVQGTGGSEALVPSVCFLLPPPNPEALEAVRR